MKKSFLVLLLAILLPSLLLGWLALRSAQEQQIVLERRTAELYQTQTDDLARSARAIVSEQRRLFAEILRQLLASESATSLAEHFTTQLHEHWPQPAVGFALDDDGHLLCPGAREAATNPQIREFLYDNSAFLGSKAAATAYPVAMDELNRPELSQRARNLKTTSYASAPVYAQKAAPPSSQKKTAAANAQGALTSVGKLQTEILPPMPESVAANALTTSRNVAPQQQSITTDESQVISASAEFRQFTAEGSEGVINRFVQDRLNMIFWVRSPRAPKLIFGCLLQVADLRSQWSGLFPPTDAVPTRGREVATDDPEFILALLDDKALPVAVSPVGSKIVDWRKPFVATEIGESLPHWEAALYLHHPERLASTAQQVRRNLFLLIGCALTAIGVGGWVVVADTRRKLDLAQKKTDFVSNVSHELKTPLTSIRMFAELMHSGRTAPERQSQYLRIIMVEAERLTRLINNVLDFAQLDRRESRLDKRPIDLQTLLEAFWPAHEFRLREAGFDARWESTAGPLPIVADADALGQVLVNLLSNAEKYGGERKEIVLRSYTDGSSVYAAVMDRGPGVPIGEEASIFEPFYRAHDSLSSGITGTGLGLALARRIVAGHGGELFYAPRPEGGSSFTVRLPLAVVPAP